jgi:DNA polymerase (family 10)
MSNKEIARAFQFLGELMELHGENPFKIRSYQNAYLTLRKLDRPLPDFSEEELAALPGIGKAIVGKIRELILYGKMEALEKYKAITPPGVEELLLVHGLGPKKLRVIWKELGIESIGELEYALNENRLLELKGFGEKTQEELRRQLAFYQRNNSSFLYAALEAPALELLNAVSAALPSIRVEWTGPLRRRSLVLQEISLLIGQAVPPLSEIAPLLTDAALQDQCISGKTKEGYPVVIYCCEYSDFNQQQFRHTGSESFLAAFDRLEGSTSTALDEAAFFKNTGLPWIEPERREDGAVLRPVGVPGRSPLVEDRDIRGVIHAHSTYSDGLHSLTEMAQEAKALGFEYLVISDHSKSAFYANGLSPERVRAQMEEIDRLNQVFSPFRIFKGIESDILADGSLDYPTEVLNLFEVVIASIHSNLKMEEEKATRRLIKAIEQPQTRILGHPTGRLLLSRPGYPIRHREVIDACSANGVAIELNANPYRLDLDYTWIPYALEKGVPIAINPDAHSKSGIRDIRFGVLAARKGGLDAGNCLNAKNLAQFTTWVGDRSPRLTAR